VKPETKTKTKTTKNEFGEEVTTTTTVEITEDGVQNTTTLIKKKF